MALGTLAAIGSVAGPLIGGVVGNIASSGDRAKASQAMQSAWNEIQQLGLPPDLSKEVYMKHLQSAGVLTPEVEKAIDVGVSKLSQVQDQGPGKDVQLEALQAIKERGKTGLTAEDRMALNKVRQQVARDQQAKQAQILQNMQARGQAGGGQELAAQLMASQAGAEQASEQGDRIAAQASQNALAAMAQAGQLGGQVRGQDFDIAAKKAAAEDEFNRFNIQNQVGQQSRNVAAQNQAQAANLANAQNISNANVGIDNQEAQRANDARRTYWQDTANRANMRAGVFKDQGNQAQAAANQTQQGWQNVGSGVGSAFGALASKLSKSPVTPTESIPDVVTRSYADEDKVDANGNPIPLGLRK